MTRVAITGANGFVGQNLRLHLRERADIEVVSVPHEGDIAATLAGAGFVVHLAGVNRPADDSGFADNPGFTARLCDTLAAAGNACPMSYASSIRAAEDTPYGRSKGEAEDVLRAHAAKTGAPVHIFRLPNVFGKWSRPDYNSAVATFCHNIARGLPIEVRDPAHPMQLVYVDDVVTALIRLIDERPAPGAWEGVSPVYAATLGEIADMIRGFGAGRETLVTEAVGEGLGRALHATYVAALPEDAFSYPIPTHGDARGMFAEMIKTRQSGQVSFFTAGPGVTRGGHYHHSKVEKFLVVKGEARFRFRHMMTGENVAFDAGERELRIVETIPGWTHDITNIGEGELISMLWANEIFDRAAPDTYMAPLA